MLLNPILSSWQKKMVKSLYTFYALGSMTVIIASIATIALFLFLVGVLFSAVGQVCAAIGQTWAESGSLAHLCMLVLGWIFITYVFRLLRRIKL